MADQQQDNSDREYKGPTHLAKYAWPKGTSGNPNGKKPGKTVTEQVKALLRAESDKGASVLENLAAAGVQAALQGDFQFWKYLVDRIDGPVKQVVEATMNQLVVQFEEESDEPVTDNDAE